MLIKLRTNSITLNDWEKNSMGNWLRQVVNGDEANDLVCLMQSFRITMGTNLDLYWCPFFFGKVYFVSDLMKASRPSFYYGVDDLELAKQEVDKFLLRVDKLWIFT